MWASWTTQIGPNKAFSDDICEEQNFRLVCILQSFASLVCEVHAVTVVSTELGVSLVEARLQDDLRDWSPMLHMLDSQMDTI